MTEILNKRIKLRSSGAYVETKDLVESRMKRMETGKVEYAPDYKSPKVGDVIGTAKIIYGDKVAQPPIDDGRTEHEKLKDAVCEAAKKWRDNSLGDWIIDPLREAVDALIDFEARK